MVLDFIYNCALANYPRQRPTACVSGGRGAGVDKSLKAENRQSLEFAY
jgi:hypothetical protein